MTATTPKSLQQQINDRRTAMFRLGLLDRVAHGEKLAAVGDHVLYFDGMRATLRKVKASDIAVVAAQIRRRNLVIGCEACGLKRADVIRTAELSGIEHPQCCEVVLDAGRDEA